MKKIYLKHNQESAEKVFSEVGMKLMDTYTTSKNKLDTICICGNIFKISLDSVKRGQKCRDCGYKNRKIPAKLSYNYIYNYFKEHGCELLETTYKDNKRKLKYKCVCGNIGHICFNSFKSGRRCQKCKGLKLSKNNCGSNNPSWNSDRDKVRKIQELHTLSTSYKRKFRKKYNVERDLVIDHIWPISAFVDYKIYDLDIINEETNLQPLTKEENRKKWYNYIKKDFETHLQLKGLL